MSDSSDKSKAEGNTPLDLSQLQDLNFGPDWSDSARAAESRGKSKPGKGGGKRPPRDRRPDRPPRKHDSGPGQAGGQHERRGGSRPPRGEGRQGGSRRDRHSAPPFKPVVDVAFYPEDTPFKALCHAMRSNCRTYELFEIARLILEKPERFVVVLHPKKEEGPQEFFISAPDGLPFTSEDQAISHVLKHHLDKFVDTEEVEVDPPKGNFPAVNKCGVTGELLGPPNYHRYQALLVEHHAINLPNMPFEKFQSRIESIKDEEVVQQWIESMRKEKRYKLKQPDATTETDSFDNLESLKFYLVNQRRNEVVRSTNQARFSGAQAEQLPRGPLRDSIFGWREQQLRFPLDTANNLRGRLRRMHFTIYKRGSKGASYVCAVKRKFRNPQTRLAESLQELMDFIEKHPNINVSELPEQFLGIDVKKAKPAEPTTEKAPDIEAVPEEVAQQIVEKHEQKRASQQEETATEDQSAVENTTSTEGESDSEAENKPAAEPPSESKGEISASTDEKPTEASTSESGQPETSPTPEPAAPSAEQLEDPQLRQLMFDLRWLVTEGYVTEYGDGRLFAPAPMDDSPRKDDSAKAKDAPKVESSDKAAAEVPKQEAKATEESSSDENESAEAQAESAQASEDDPSPKPEEAQSEADGEEKASPQKEKVKQPS